MEAYGVPVFYSHEPDCYLAGATNLIYLQCPYHITSIHTHTLDLITRLMRTQAAYLHTRAFTLLHGHAGTPSRSHVHAGTPSRGRAGLPAQKPSVERQRHGVELC